MSTKAFILLALVGIVSTLGATAIVNKSRTVRRLIGS